MHLEDILLVIRKTLQNFRIALEGNFILSLLVHFNFTTLLYIDKKTLFLFQHFDSVTIMFCELVGFNSTTVKDAMDVVCSMNAVFSCFDSLMDKFNVYKVGPHIHLAKCANLSPIINTH